MVSPLQLASGNGDIKSMQLLLKNGANVNHHESEDGLSPLIQAVQAEASKP
jgi:ankyrin repeat protein